MLPRSSILIVALLLPSARAQDSVELAARARTIFKTHCHRCHHGEGSDGGSFDVLDPKTLLSAAEGEKPVIVRGKLDESKLWLRAGVKKNMPPKAITARPAEAELDVLRKWIEAGAPIIPKEEKQRKFISVETTLKTLRDHVQNADDEDRPYLRYFSLVHLYNNPRVPDEDLAIHRAALAKAINSLSWKSRLVIPEALDRDQTLLAIDLRDLDWDRVQHWQALTASYPYGLTFDEENALRKLDRDFRTMAGCSIPVVRADWFIATATRPPLYHTLLGLPRHARDLEKQLKVNVADNFRRNRLDRSAFPRSGVSGQNRLIERHDALFGAYWKSYDFKEGGEKGDLVELPLGPLFPGHKWQEAVFKHDGGEIIFNLPNGLQGYLLVDGEDQRIDEGPIKVVSDSQKTSGTNVIVNGLSCMACHGNGMIRPPSDVVRERTSVQGDLRRKVQRLYPPGDRMTALIKEDEDRFLRAVQKAAGSFIKGPVRDLPAEPIGEVARLYGLQELDVAMTACELGLEKPEELKGMIRGNRRLRELGLGPLLQEGGVVKRNTWEKGTFSVMQRVARELQLGSPVRESAP